MTQQPERPSDRVALSRSQRNIYNGVLQNDDPALYLIGKSYRFRPLELPAFLAALAWTIAKNPAHLCVLEAAPAEGGYPDLAPRLGFDDLVRVRPEEEDAAAFGGELARTWSDGLLGKPLMRYTVRLDARGAVSGLEAHAHHILFDGGATGAIETELARHLAGEAEAQAPGLGEGLAKLAEAHRRENAKAEEASGRFAEAVRRELADEARRGDGQERRDAPASAAKGVRQGEALVSGQAYETLLALAEAERVPLNVLVAAAATAVDASLRQSVEGLLVHAVDNRFGDPDLNVATCLVNSVAHPVRFPPFASTREVARALDRAYVAAVRRRWFREEQYRRMYLTVNRTSRLAALTLNFIREACAPGLRRFLSEAPAAADIGPVEGMTVACVLDEERRSLRLSVWDRADLPEDERPARIAERIAAALESMAAKWDQPIATIVGEWAEIGPDGARRPQDEADPAERRCAPAWFLDPEGSVRAFLDRRGHVLPWAAWLARRGIEPGEVVVLADDHTDKTVDLLVACHLAGCGYSVCDSADEAPERADEIAAQGLAAHVVDVAAVRLAADLGDESRELVGRRFEQVARDDGLADRTAYIMPTSGSTGRPKLVRISHRSLALFCASARSAYGWGSDDVLLQCAPLTSDISVEEIFCGAACGTELVRSAAVRAGDIAGLVRDLVGKRATVVDLPTAVWHLLCEDGEALGALRCSALRQIVIGGEAVRPGAVGTWVRCDVSRDVSLVSTYGPTEATVVATALPLADELADAGAARLGRPLVPGSVFVAFGEVVVVGDLVSSGYLGMESPSFGTVTTGEGPPRRAFATADRVAFDDEGFPVLLGRRDAVVKISGKRVDIAEVARRIAEDPAVADAGVEARDGSLGVWFQARRTSEGGAEAETAARLRSVLLGLGVASFFVVGVARILRKPNGKIDGDSLRAMSPASDARPAGPEPDETSAGLAAIWSSRLGTEVGPDSSLLAEGVGSLDLMRILPDTRAYLGRPLTILDLIRADSAARLVAESGADPGELVDAEAAAEIARDLADLRSRGLAAPGSRRSPRGTGAVLVLGASGILGTGFAQAALDLRRAGARLPDVVLAARSEIPERAPWTEILGVAGIRIAQAPARLGAEELDDLIRASGARTVVNCVGNTNVLAPYRELRAANVEPVAALVEVCAARGARLAHLSTFVVGAEAAAPRVVDPRASAYPYAASKALAELVVAGSPPELDFALVRLPRVLGTADQMRDSADVLVSIAQACAALRAHPAVALTEEVTTGRAVARGLLGLLPELAGSAGLGRGLLVARGAKVAYAEFLAQFGPEELDLPEWKRRLDRSGWAKRNPGRWAVIDAWAALGERLGARSYADYLADRRTVALGVEAVAEFDGGRELSAVRSRLVRSEHGGFLEKRVY
ncbi:AMP-binding protein [Segniliparus rugosus]|uniref:Peptide synthase n=1 Tax=Segniliparus rugosus (strain ATCC BAA-974 / DSM 45345 / CCUG 50838 / CIP 108380 / JCM 13579 / CDC 945) TaxID=679197 RepID=E5XM49_SEGRC|nr:AMP-binding protein [Segniliparus rugosus]EFV14580.1 hypothetical protein HMPREF9336_00569 [Segniliparus rugosus ATCC BAA-974]